MFSYAATKSINFESERQRTSASGSFVDVFVDVSSQRRSLVFLRAISIGSNYYEKYSRISMIPTSN
jgi:hypothetical protein